MDIFHHVSFNSRSQEALLNMIKNLNIKYQTDKLPGNGGAIVSFDIFESDTNWNKVLELLQKYKQFTLYQAGDLYETVFSEKDVREAEWLRLVSTFEKGQPQPEANWPFSQSTYENVCPKCAIYQQVDVYRFKKEFSLRGCSFVSPLAVNEFLCTPEVFSGFESISAKGFDTKKVLISSFKKPSDVVQQLYVPTIAGPGLSDTNEMKKTVCSECNTVKYYAHKKGIMKFKRNTVPTGVDFFKTFEWFGFARVAYREILISNRVAQLILDKGWKGVRMKVVELV